MQVLSSYAVELLHANKIFLPTVNFYRNAISFLMTYIDKEWDVISQVPTTDRQRFCFTENMFHKTKSTSPKYDFDTKFPKMPSYLRRAAISKALGAVSSYHTRLKQWEDNKCKGKRPGLTVDCNDMPCFYNTNMYRETDDPTVVFLKLYLHNDWVWKEFRVLSTDVKYIQKHCSYKKKSAPTLECRRGKWFLRFCFEHKVELCKLAIYQQRICAVDLGINTDAVCTVMEPDGTILARKFINFPCEKDQLVKVLGRIRRFQRQHGSYNSGSRWAYAKRLNKELSYKIATAITNIAILYGCSTIVFENLDMKGKKRGKNKQKLAMWRKNGIQDVVMHKAHENGIHVSRVCPWNTSSLAYDGSGKVSRGKFIVNGQEKANYSMCVFQNGKTYHCDLNASYNIGARYYCREMLKTLPETVRFQVEAKVPGCGRRTSCVYADLIDLYPVYMESLTEFMEQEQEIA